MAMGDADIEGLVEAQARGEDVGLPLDPPAAPVATQLDTRRSKSSLGGGLLFGQPGGEADLEADAPPDAQQAAAAEAETPPPELGTAAIERQDLALAQDLPIPSDEELGLVFRTESM